MSEEYTVTIEGDGMKIMRKVSPQKASAISNILLKVYPKDHPLFESKDEAIK